MSAGLVGRLIVRNWFAATLGVVLMVAGASAASAQVADTVLFNGKVLTVDQQFSTRSAVAVREGRIMAVGSDADVRKLAGPSTRTVDLQGRTVIPGLIDSHMHATRAALSFSTEVNWIGAASLADALGRLREASRKVKPGAWLVVVTPPATLDTFRERRRPRQDELVAAAPNNPVYVQLAYGWAMLTPLALKTLNINTDADLPKGNTLERDATGKPTGAITGNLVDIGIPQIWSKAISNEHARILQRIGAHHVVLPEADAGARVAHLVSGKLLDYIEVEDGFTIVKMRPPKETQGFTLAQSKVRERYGVTVIGVKSPGIDFVYATPDTRLSTNDLIIVSGHADLLERFAARP